MKFKLFVSSIVLMLAVKGTGVTEFLTNKENGGNLMRRLDADNTEHSMALITSPFTVTEANTGEAKFEPKTLTIVSELEMVTGCCRESIRGE